MTLRRSTWLALLCGTITSGGLAMAESWPAFDPATSSVAVDVMAPSIDARARMETLETRASELDIERAAVTSQSRVTAGVLRVQVGLLLRIRRAMTRGSSLAQAVSLESRAALLERRAVKTAVRLRVLRTQRELLGRERQGVLRELSAWQTQMGQLPHGGAASLESVEPPTPAGAGALRALQAPLGPRLPYGSLVVHPGGDESSVPLE